MNSRQFTGAAALAVTLCLGAVGARADIAVRVNGDPVYFGGEQPRQINGRVMVPLRGVLEKIGATVYWMPDTRTVRAIRNSTEINLPIGSRVAYINGRDVSLDVPAMTLNGTTMVPLRFVSEALGADVKWMAATQTVNIAMDGVTASNTIGSSGINGNGTANNMQAYRRPRANARLYTRRMALAVGTVIPVKLDEELNSSKERAGDRFTATVESGSEDAGLPEGTKFEGVVREAIPSRDKKPGVLDVDFTRMILPDGTSRAVSASVISLDSKSVTHNASGQLVARSNSGNDRLKWVGIGAGAGLLIGTLTKGNALVDALLGAGAGYLYNELQRKGPSDVNLKSGTRFGVRMDQRVALDIPTNSGDTRYDRNNNRRDDRYYRDDENR